MNPLLLAILWGAAAAGNPFQEVHYDFRGQALPGDFNVFGNRDDLLISVEPQGLRLTLPKGRKDLGRAGLNLPVAVQGDFEITTTFEILRADEPPAGFGVGVLLAVNQKARLGRLARPDGQQVILWDRVVVDEARRLVGDTVPCAAKTGRLRLKRSGTTLHFLWSRETEGDTFEQVHQYEFGTEDISLIRLIAETGRQPCALDVRIADLRIRTESRGEEQRSHWKVWLAGAILALMIGSSMAAWLYLRQRRRALRMPAGAKGTRT